MRSLYHSTLKLRLRIRERESQVLIDDLETRRLLVSETRRPQSPTGDVYPGLRRDSQTREPKIAIPATNMINPITVMNTRKTIGSSEKANIPIFIGPILLVLLENL
jgi:hypothetical protein